MSREWTRRAIASWGVVCVLLLLAQAVVRLTPIAIDAWKSAMPLWQRGVFLAWVGFNGYAEGFKAFQQRFSPRVMSRAAHLADRPTLLRVVLALPFCMSLYHSKPRQLWVSRSMVVLIVTTVIVVRQFPQPWRGLVDAGVVIGLVWGMGSLLWLWVRFLLTGEAPEVVDLPDHARGVPAVA